MSYSAFYNGSINVFSSVLTEPMWFNFQKEDSVLDHFTLFVKKPGVFNIEIYGDYSAFPIYELVEEITKFIKEIDPQALMSGQVYYEGEDDEDNGYVDVVDIDTVKTYVKYTIYVQEKDYTTVNSLVNRYLESDMQEFIQEGIK